MENLDLTKLHDKVARCANFMTNGNVEQWVTEFDDWIIKRYFQNRFEYSLYIPRPWEDIKERVYLAFTNEYYFRFL